MSAATSVGAAAAYKPQHRVTFASPAKPLEYLKDIVSIALRAASPVPRCGNCQQTSHLPEQYFVCFATLVPMLPALCG
jgi:hypothetical protein